MQLLAPAYKKHVPLMTPAVHRNVYRAFHQCIDSLVELIRRFELQDTVEVSLLHRHTESVDDGRYIEYFQHNHFVQVELTRPMIEYSQVRAEPYSFYFRNGRVYALEYTTCNLTELGYAVPGKDFFDHYGDILERNDLDDVFGARFNYKSRLLKTQGLIENNVGGVSLTSRVDEREQLDFDEVVRTAWSAGDAKCVHCKSHCGLHICVGHCSSHPICHPTGCVMPAPWDPLIYPVYEKMRGKIHLGRIQIPAQGGADTAGDVVKNASRVTGATG